MTSGASTYYKSPQIAETIVTVQPGTGTLAAAILAYTGTGATLQLKAGTYNVDLTTLPATVSDLWIVGVGNPGGITNQAPSVYTTGQSVIVITAGTPSSGSPPLWKNFGFSRVVITGPLMASNTALLNNSLSSNGNFNLCLFFDMAGDITGTNGFGPDLYCEANIYVQSNAGVTMAQRWNIPLGPYWSVNEVWDFQITATGRFIGASGALPQAGVTYGPYYIWGPTVMASGQFTQDVFLDLEFGPSSGLSYIECIGAKITNTKLAYLTNVQEAHFIRPRQTLNLQNAGVGNGFPLIMPGGTTQDYFSTNGYIEVDSPTIIHLTNSNPAATQFYGVLYWGTKTAKRGEYFRRLWWHGGTIIANPASGQPAASAQPTPGLFTVHFPTSDGYTQVADELTIEDVTIGFNRSGVDSSAAQPTAIPIVQISPETTATIAKVKIGPFRVMGATGQSNAVTPGTSPWTYTHGTTNDAGGVPADGGSVVSVTGGTTTAIQTVINGVNVNTGLTAGSFYLAVGDQLIVTYSGAAPTVVYYTVPGGPSQPTTAGNGTNALFTYPVSLGQAAMTMTVNELEIGDMSLSELAANAWTGTAAAPSVYVQAGTVNIAKLRYRPSIANFLSAQAAAVASVVTFTVPGSAGATSGDVDFEVGGMTNITTVGTSLIAIFTNFTPEAGAAQTADVTPQSPANGSNGAASNTARQWRGFKLYFRAKGGTAITIGTSGTFTTDVYDVSARIEIKSSF